MTEPCPSSDQKVVEVDVARLKKILHEQSNDYRLTRGICKEMIDAINRIACHLDKNRRSNVFFAHCAFLILNKEEVGHRDYQVLASEAEDILRQYEQNVTKQKN